MVRSTRSSNTSPGTARIEVVRADGEGEKLVLATVESGFMAASPARLPDGRVVFIRSDPFHSGAEALGEMWVIERDGRVRTTGLTAVLALTVVGDRVVYEVGGMNNVTDLSMTDLENPPVNITNTRYISEHLAWSN